MDRDPWDAAIHYIPEGREYTACEMPKAQFSPADDERDYIDCFICGRFQAENQMHDAGQFVRWFSMEDC